MNTPDTNGAIHGEAWETFAAKVAEVANVRPEEVRPETRVVEDLNLDSLALAELLVLLLVDLGLDELSESLQDSDWRELQVGTLYDEYRASKPCQPAFKWA